MRNAYTNSLNELTNQFFELGNAVKESLDLAMEAFEKRDIKLAQQIVDNDHNINEAHAKIEKDAIELIALQQPVTKDLRLIITALKAGVNLERMADHASTIANLTIDLDRTKTYDANIENTILKMGAKASQMLTDMLKAFENSDIDFAKSLALQDADIDELDAKVVRKVARLLREENDETKVYMIYLTIASSIERYGDYITNLSELLVYLETGELVELNGKAKAEAYAK